MFSLIQQLLFTTQSHKMYFLFSYIIVPQKAALNFPPLQAESRHKSDLKTKTTIVLPSLLISSVMLLVFLMQCGAVRRKAKLKTGLLSLSGMVSLSSAVNPVIQYLRTNRFRLALKQFLKDLFGSSEFKEEFSGNGRRKEGKIK